jgi:hypothetical protein
MACPSTYGDTTYICPDATGSTSRNPLSDASIGISSSSSGPTSATILFSVTGITKYTPSNSECPGNSPAYIPIVTTIMSKIGEYSLDTNSPTYNYRETDGLLKSTTLTGGTTGYPNGLIKDLNICIRDKLPSDFTNASIDKCNVDDTVFIQGVQYEYAYYYARYLYAIQKMSAALQCTDSMFGTYNRRDAIKKYTEAAIILNMMVNDIIYTMDQISQARTNEDISTLTTKLNAADRGLAEQSMKLQKQRELLMSSGQNKMLLHKEMETYSRQKARYHNNMLMLYSFLNITALGLLFYVYRST